VERLWAPAPLRIAARRFRRRPSGDGDAVSLLCCVVDKSRVLPVLPNDALRSDVSDLTDRAAPVCVDRLAGMGTAPSTLEGAGAGAASGIPLHCLLIEPAAAVAVGASVAVHGAVARHGTHDKLRARGASARVAFGQPCSDQCVHPYDHVLRVFLSALECRRRRGGAGRRAVGGLAGRGPAGQRWTPVA
jgi:hypothetical protein